jgi:translation elongation factor P/translation initiation factor 5A
VTSKSELDRAVELARESPLDKVLRLAQPPPPSTGQVKSYMRGGHAVSGYQGQAGQAKPGSSKPTSIAQLKIGSVIQVGGIAYRVLAKGAYKPPVHKGGVVANTKGKTTTTNTAVKGKGTTTKKASAGAKSVSPQKALFSGTPAAGQASIQLQQVSTGAKFNVHVPPTVTVPVVA